MSTEAKSDAPIQDLRAGQRRQQSERRTPALTGFVFEGEKREGERRAADRRVATPAEALADTTLGECNYYNCNCVDEVNRSLAIQSDGTHQLFQQLFMSMVGDDSSTSITLAFENKKGKIEASGLRPKYCPFCGERYSDVAKVGIEREPKPAEYYLTTPGQRDLRRGVQELVDACYSRSEAGGWWHELETGERKVRNVPEMLCLIHSEISEAMEGHRKNLPDDKLPDRPMFEVEGADALIRIGDTWGGLRDPNTGKPYDLAGAVVEKLLYNANRADHKPENRRGENGKKF